jgi:hypothetical protein
VVRFGSESRSRFQAPQPVRICGRRRA